MKKLKLLIVDDSILIRKKIERVHDKSRYELVGQATDGAEAIIMCDKFKPDVVTMDLTMPHIDGIESISRLMSLDPSVCILVVSALSDEATGIRALKNGATGFLMKPFNDEQLLEALEIATEGLAA